MKNKRIGIITSSRAEYGLLKPLITRLSSQCDLKLIVTGMHLSPEFGYTYKLIEEDGIKIDEKIEILLSSDSAVGVSKAMGLAMISFSEVYNRLNLDCIIVLGDRFEILAATSTAVVANIPVVHLHGGELTEGAYDDAFRHSITKMSNLHFTSTEEYRRRVIQLGESPKTVFNVGAIGIDSIYNIDLMTKEEFERSINFKLDKEYALVTFHPVTLENNDIEIQIKEVLAALEAKQNLKYIITKANSDNNGRLINKLLEEFENSNKERVKLFDSMGQVRYLSAMKHCSIVIGNSSSGIIEAPSFKVPTINIGNRQKGRVQADTILNCEPKRDEILKCINEALSNLKNGKYRDSINPYGDGNTTDKILKNLKEFLSQDRNIVKIFYDL